MSVFAILQARVSSSRLPGKVVRTMHGKPMLQHQIERVLRSKLIDKLIIATSEHPEDDLLAEISEKVGVYCFRGSLNDVLGRFYNAVNTLECQPEHIVRLTGDCPLIDSEVIDRVIEHHLKTQADYTSNGNPPTYPDGLDVEIMKFSVLQEAFDKAIIPSDREHVTPYIRKNPKYRLENVTNSKDLSNLRWTVDELSDFEFVEKVYSRIYDENPQFLMSDVLSLLSKEPELSIINAHYQRNEGYEESLKNDPKK